MTTHLHIGRLVIDGVSLPANAGEGVRQAMEAELSRLLAEAPLEHASSGATERLPTSPITVDAKQSPAALGTAAARSLYEGLCS